MNAEKSLDRIDAILAEIERLDVATGGQYRQESDKEALNIVRKIERKVLQNKGKRLATGIG